MHAFAQCMLVYCVATVCMILQQLLRTLDVMNIAGLFLAPFCALRVGSWPCAESPQCIAPQHTVLWCCEFTFIIVRRLENVLEGASARKNIAMQRLRRMSCVCASEAQADLASCLTRSEASHFYYERALLRATLAACYCCLIRVNALSNLRSGRRLPYITL